MNLAELHWHFWVHRLQQDHVPDVDWYPSGICWARRVMCQMMNLNIPTLNHVKVKQRMVIPWPQTPQIILQLWLQILWCPRLVIHLKAPQTERPWNNSLLHLQVVEADLEMMKAYVYLHETESVYEKEPARVLIKNLLWDLQHVHSELKQLEVQSVLHCILCTLGIS